jgi:hypothetical protein
MLSGASILDTLDRFSISFCRQNSNQQTQQNGQNSGFPMLQTEG